MSVCEQCRKKIDKPNQEAMHCPKCQCTSHRLVMSDGWYCNQCNAGPHILHSNNKLKEKSL